MMLKNYPDALFSSLMSCLHHINDETDQANRVSYPAREYIYNLAEICWLPDIFQVIADMSLCISEVDCIIPFSSPRIRLFAESLRYFR